MQINFTSRTKARDMVKARTKNGHYAKLVDKGANVDGKRWGVALRPVTATMVN